MTDRRDRLLAGLTKQDRIIEIGPLHGPLAPKAEGWSTTVVDRGSRDELLASYTGHEGVDLDKIEDVDVVWRDGPLHEAFPAQQHGTYRAVIASHALEHIPNPIGFLASAARLVGDDGTLMLALPDKRWCFDLFKPVSTTGELLEAARTNRSRHNGPTLFDHNAYSASVGGQPAFGREAQADIAFYVSLEKAKEAFSGCSEGAEAAYVDCHAWQFTPASFQLVLLELAELGDVDWHVEAVTPEPSVEFTAVLRRGRRAFADEAARDARRLQLLIATAEELAEQADWFRAASGRAQAGPISPAAPAPAGLTALETRVKGLEDELRPVRALLDRLLPLRQRIARWRGRV